MAIEMQRTPSYLKGLAETRARAAGDVQRLKELHSEITRQLATAEAEVASCDLLIRKFDKQLDPTKIPPIRAWKGHYGKRGALREAVLRELEAAWPRSVSTTELAAKIQLEFKLDFTTWRERDQWCDQSVRNLLRKSVKDGVLERDEPAISAAGRTVNRWRWVPQTATELSTLREAAQAVGVGVQQATKKRGRPRKAAAVTL
jgi:hypothetical protein